ncbi:hypothetical protein A45J_0408 [hot springs metagenome]|uniref:Tape measure protein N-terminal domain-containing protein n=1 Tax=hot springs metagenome TaxID=433727 RepID=A0A5J4L1I0_9ZZZZ
MPEVRIAIVGDDKASPAAGAVASSMKNAAGAVDTFSHACQKASGRTWDFIKGLIGFESLKSSFNTIKNIAKDMLDTASTFEKTDIMLTRMFGSAKAGKAAFDWLIDFAAKMPFQLDSMQKSFIKLQVAGMNPMSGSLRILADSIAAFGGSSQDLELSSVAIQQMAGKGVISMEELRQQLGERIPTAIQIMAKELGVSMPELFDMIEKGSLSAKKGLDALFKGLDKEYGGAAEGMMNSISGIFTQFEVLWKRFIKEVADAGGFDTLKFEIQSLKDNIDKAFETGKTQQWAKNVSNGIESVIFLAKLLSNIVSTLYTGMQQVSAIVLAVSAGIFKASAMFGWLTDKLGISKGAYEEWTLAATAAWGASKDLWEWQGSAGQAKEINNAADATEKLGNATNTAADAQERNKQEIESTVKALAGASKAMSQYGADMIKFADQDFKDAKISIEGVLKVIDTVFNTQLSMQSKIKDAIKSAGASQQDIAQQQAAMLETEKKGAEARLAVWEQYYASLKQKQQELVGIQTNTQDMLLSIEQKTMSPREKYFSQVRRLEEKESMAMKLSSDEKIKMLQQVQQAWAGLTDEVKEDDTVYISQAQAIYEATSRIKSIGAEIEAEKKKQLESQSSAFTSIENAMAKAQEMIEHYRQQVLDLGNEFIAAQGKAAIEIKLDNSAAKAAIEEIKAGIQSIPDVTYKKVIVESYTKASPERPFTEGIEYMKGKMDELNTTAKYTMDLSSLSGAINAYAQLRWNLNREGLTGLKDSAGWQAVWQQIYAEPTEMMRTAIYKALGADVKGSYASGTSYVPKTGYYQLHQGERVINRSESASYDQRRYANNITFAPNITIKGGDKDPRQIAREIAKPLINELKRLKNMN